MKERDREALDKLLLKLMCDQDRATHYNQTKHVDGLHQAQLDRENTRRQILAFVEALVPG